MCYASIRFLLRGAWNLRLAHAAPAGRQAHVACRRSPRRSGDTRCRKRISGRPTFTSTSRSRSRHGDACARRKTPKPPYYESTRDVAISGRGSISGDPDWVGSRSGSRRCRPVVDRGRRVRAKRAFTARSGNLDVAEKWRSEAETSRAVTDLLDLRIGEVGQSEQEIGGRFLLVDGNVAVALQPSVGPTHQQNRWIVAVVGVAVAHAAAEIDRGA